MRTIVISFLVTAAFAGFLVAQSQTTIVVPAASPVAAAAPQAPAAQVSSGPIQGALRMLQEMKATNEDTLRKQEATLDQLEQLEKDADQIRIYTKRG